MANLFISRLNEREFSFVFQVEVKFVKYGDNWSSQQQIDVATKFSLSLNWIWITPSWRLLIEKFGYVVKRASPHFISIA